LHAKSLYRSVQLLVKDAKFTDAREKLKKVTALDVLGAELIAELEKMLEDAEAKKKSEMEESMKIKKQVIADFHPEIISTLATAESSNLLASLTSLQQSMPYTFLMSIKFAKLAPTLQSCLPDICLTVLSLFAQFEDRAAIEFLSK